jgi:hypothetical protein
MIYAVEIRLIYFKRLKSESSRHGYRLPSTTHAILD